MSYLGYNVSTAMAEAGIAGNTSLFSLCCLDPLLTLGLAPSLLRRQAERQCGRCPNFYASESIGWWCLTLQAQGRTDVGDCLDAFGCKYLGDCNVHGGTPLADACPGA